MFASATESATPQHFRAPSFSENLDVCLAIEEQTMQQACQQTAQAASEWMPFVEDPTEPLPGHPFDLLPCNKSTRLHNASLGGNLKEHPFGFLWNVGGKEYGSGMIRESERNHLDQSEVGKFVHPFAI